MQREIWENIPEYGGDYQISNYGNIRSFKQGKQGEIKTGRNYSDGYPTIPLWRDGKVRNYKIHKLVAKVFLPKPHKDYVVNHIDGNKCNNSVENLEWVTRKENAQHAFRMGLIMPRYGRNNPMSRKVEQYDLSGNLIKQWESLSDAQRETSINCHNISACCANRRKKAGGYIWKYV